jgi:rare lipoprotein A
MSEATNRPGRTTRSRIALALACGLLTIAAAPAHGATGGAATATATQAQSGAGIAFTPMRWAGATWYGPGLYGNTTACGQVLRPGTVGVAHRSLPCGTRVRFVYGGRALVTRVIDRGPFSAGHDWDLTNGAREALGFEGSDRVGYAVELRYARG